MSDGPKTILWSRMTPLGRVVVSEGREAVEFKDSTGMPCTISEGVVNEGNPDSRGLWVSMDGNLGLLINAAQVLALTKVLNHWLSHNKFSDYDHGGGS